MSKKIHRNALKEGHKVQWYVIRHILGQGGFGITYLAYDLNLNKEFAIKEYLPIEIAVREGDHSVHPATTDNQTAYETGLKNFINEARTLSKFSHPNIVKIYTVFEENNTAYMVMEFEQGKTMREILKNRKIMEETRLLNILTPLIGAINYLHNAKYIHRDIKPDNILIRDSGDPVLIDFGAARQTLVDKALTTIVTPGYAPIEQYQSDQNQQGAWTDIYSLSATLYRATCGMPPADAIDRSNALAKGSTNGRTMCLTGTIPKVCISSVGVTFSDAVSGSTSHATPSRTKYMPYITWAKPRPTSIDESALSNCGGRAH